MRVFFFIMFIFAIFAIFGTNQFAGQQYQFCRATLEPEYINGVFQTWSKLGENEDGPVLCKVDADCVSAFPNAEVAVCGSVYGATGLDPIDHDGVRDIELIMYGIPGFDNVAQGFLAIFQILTLESWVNMMYNYCDTGAVTISVIFFVFVVLIGAFFTMNLVLAIIVDAFNTFNEEEKERKESLQAELEERLALESTNSENKEAKVTEEDLSKAREKLDAMFREDSD